MTNPFVRVDISQNSRDFQALALEPGLPLLDRTNSNGQLLRKWLGELVAEPERTGDSVGFHVRDAESRRLDSVLCVPVLPKDLTENLSEDFDELVKRVESIRPQSTNEILLARVIGDQVRKLASESNTTDRQACLFKFRDRKSDVHLVWLPGYRRRDNAPAVALVCCDPKCSNLFLQRETSNPKCPACHAEQRPTRLDGLPKQKFMSLRNLILCACIFAIGFWARNWWQAPPNANESNTSDRPVSLRGSPTPDTSIKIPVGSELSDSNDEIRVLPSIVGPLEVQPSLLVMKAGEVAKIGHEIKVTQAGLDVSDSVEAVAVSNRNVTYDADSRMLAVITPGNSQIALIVREQFVILKMSVESRDDIPAHSTIVIESSDGPLAVGEKRLLRAFTVTPDGTRSSVSAVFTSSDLEVADVSDSAIQGLKPGEVTVEARVQEIDRPGRITFTVEQIEFERLAFNPAVLSSVVGQRKSFEIFGVISRGRVRLGDDSNLKILVLGSSDKDLGGFEIECLKPGNAVVAATWNGGREQRMPVSVKSDRVLELLIWPDASTVSEGESEDYLVIARHEGQLHPVGVVDGVELSIGDSKIAEKKELQVKAIKAGKSKIIAKYGALRATAELTVTSER